ncbi:hypothetical protein [Nocardioides cynanchi]|uniref:hypothetical protein n=1 Tax=Nocardioides cynanchi TaxID=2558918 RepID=UPI001247AAED|nr:hypothetical protein [Nocardioides cynanchi]
MGSRPRPAWVGLLLAAPFVLGIASASGTPADRVFTFRDPAIVEASALVVEDGLFLTTNDSGDSGRVFAVAPDGRTVGVTHWSTDPTDCEALAPAGPGEVWVGDIGDNLAERSTVSITRVPVGRGERTVQPTTYRLAYPDGAHDAETLLRNPVSGRLYLATKGLFGGEVYAVPAQLSATAVNHLHKVGQVLPVATDGSFFPDGRHLVVRDYTSATVYDWPSLREVASFPLPAQRQGEGIAVAADGSVYVSSEGARAPVLRVSLPHDVRRAVAPAGPSPSPSPGSSATSTPGSESSDATRSAWPWAVGGLVTLGALLVLVRALRPR